MLNKQRVQLLELMAVDEDLDLFPCHSFGQVLLVKLQRGLLLAIADVVMA